MLLMGSGWELLELIHWILGMRSHPESEKQNEYNVELILREGDEIEPARVLAWVRWMGSHYGRR